MKVLLATINPCPKISKPSQNIFENPEIVDCNKMLVSALSYKLGAEATEFAVHFGQTNDLEGKQTFSPLRTERIVLSSNELSTWGFNDEDCYKIIAKKIGINCTSFDLIDIDVIGNS